MTTKFHAHPLWGDLLQVAPLEALEGTAQNFREQIAQLKRGESIMVGDPPFEVSGPEALEHAEKGLRRVEEVIEFKKWEQEEE